MKISFRYLTHHLCLAGSGVSFHAWVKVTPQIFCSWPNGLLSEKIALKGLFPFSVWGKPEPVLAGDEWVPCLKITAPGMMDEFCNN